MQGEYHQFVPLLYSTLVISVLQTLVGVFDTACQANCQLLGLYIYISPVGLRRTGYANKVNVENAYNLPLASVRY